MRFWDPGEGHVRLSGHDLRDFELEDLRRQIALVSQDTYLFNSSIRDNLSLGKIDATDKEIEDAARQANAHDFISAFPDGYDTLVGERGMQLSGGQRQRISIARAILKNAPVLILDEATSHLDASNERTVRQALATLMEGRTTVVITHPLSTIRDTMKTGMKATKVMNTKDTGTTSQGRCRTCRTSTLITIINQRQTPMITRTETSAGRT